MYSKNLFKDKVALVTGGRSGIGYAIAQMMLEHGTRVIICSRKADLLAQAASELKQFGDCDHKACDTRDGGQFPALAEMISDNGWNAVIKNNLNGTFFMTRDMAKAFFIPQKEGIIVNITANIYRGFPGMIHTGAARAGVENLTKTLAQEWADFNIRINCIAPGIIESSGLEQYPAPVQDMFKEAKKAIPLRRFGTVEDVANAVCFFASPLASYITGTTLYVDGAQHLSYDTMGLARVMKSFL